MTAILIAAGALASLTLIAGLALTWAHARLPANDDGLVDAIDALLPQTQCGQCGHPGCRPYAEALAQGAPMDLCPPGGQETFAALKALLGRDDGAAPAEPQPATARIREPECIGCALCLAPCPVDAIVGAPSFMHTVIEDQCTGCELCLPACPVDCIELVAMPAPAVRKGARAGCPRSEDGDPRAGRPRSGDGDPRAGRPRSGDLSERGRPALELNRESSVHAPCIGCNRCEPVCPESLAPQHLLRLIRSDQPDAAAATGLGHCIECRRCDRACPSGIPLAHLFRAAKDDRAERTQRQARAAATKARFDARNARLKADDTDAHARRAQRLAAGSARQW